MTIKNLYQTYSGMQSLSQPKLGSEIMRHFTRNRKSKLLIPKKSHTTNTIQLYINMSAHLFSSVTILSTCYDYPSNFPPACLQDFWILSYNCNIRNNSLCMECDRVKLNLESLLEICHGINMSPWHMSMECWKTDSIAAWILRQTVPHTEWNRHLGSDL